MASLLIAPARCTATLADDLEKDYYVGEPKIDGSRYVLYLGTGVDPYERRPGNTLLSRRVSSVDEKHVDKSDNVPHITNPEIGPYIGLEGTTLDGEMFKTDFPTTAGIMGSGPALAVEKQKTSGWITYYVFDCMVFRGIDIRGKSLAERRKVAAHVVKTMNNPNVKLVPQWGDNFGEHFNAMVAVGGEGLVIKDTRLGYGIGWAKMKKTFDVSCVISGFKPGNGKYESSLGAMTLSVYENGKLLEVGYCSGFDDKLRQKMAENPGDFIGKVVDVFAHELTKDKRIRHATWHRFRDDVEASDCTLEKLKDDMSRKARSNRHKEE